MDYYITLPSDSSLDFFPDNKISSFITQLPQSLHLTGAWEVALTEIYFPHTWYNVNETNNLIEYEIPGKDKPYQKRIPPGFYPTVQSILDAISVNEFKDKFSFTFNEVTKRVRMTVYGVGNIILHPGMAELLGFDPMDFGSEEELDYFAIESAYIPDPYSQYRVLMVYTDIIEQQIVGNVFTPLLRIVNVTGNHGDMVHLEYNKPHYLPLSRKLIDTIQIDIRTHTGHFAHFEFGRSIIRLHVRERKLS